MEQTTAECEILDLAEKLHTTIGDKTEKILHMFVKCNEVLKRFDMEEIIPVGSSVDDSKVNTPEDFGDVDVLVVPKTINLDESLFEYEREYPSFLRLRGDSIHATYFDADDLVDKQWVKAKHLKDINNNKYFVLTKLLWTILTLPMSIIKSTAVGFEFSFYDLIVPFLTQGNNFIDCVPAFSFCGWPRPAREWLHRKRYWPHEEVIRESVNTGCQIVAKKPLFPSDTCNEDSSSNEIEKDVFFRLSFSRCELVLAKTMSTTQRLLLRILKAYQKGFLQVKPKVLASYHWKNVVFWISEEESPEFWKPENLLQAILKALDFIIVCLTDEFIPFYFVRDENLIAGCRQDKILETLQIVQEIRNRPLDTLREFIQCSPKPEKQGIHPLDLKPIVENNSSIDEFVLAICSLFKTNPVSDPTFHFLHEPQRLFWRIGPDFIQGISAIETDNILKKVMRVFSNDLKKAGYDTRNDTYNIGILDLNTDDLSENDQKSNVEVLKIIMNESYPFLGEEDKNTVIKWILGAFHFLIYGYGNSFSEENLKKNFDAIRDIFYIVLDGIVRMYD